MAKYNYNELLYELHLTNVSDSKIHVLSFEGKERISDLFEFKIDIVSDNAELDSSVILNNVATFVWNRGDEDPIKIHGIISHFEQLGNVAGYTYYKVVLAPRIWRLNLIYQNEVYLNANIEKLIENVMEDVGLSGQDYKVDLKNSYPKKEYVVQYKETDLDFMNRWLEHYGIFYYFDHSNEKDVVVFTDSNTKFSPIRLNENIGFNINKDPLSDKESIMEISCKEKVVTGLFQVKDYNYMFPEKQLMAQSQINSNHPGLYYGFGENFENESEAELIAKIRNQEILCGSKIYYGKSDCRLFTAGYKFNFEKHFREDWNGEYIITSVTHHGNQENLFAFLPGSGRHPSTYENKFETIPFSMEFRPVRKTRIPKVYGIMSAKIESGEGDEYAYIDDHGRYRAKMLFDLTDVSNGEATLPIRLTQSYSGPGYGIHFPNHEDTELLWSCVDGNPDRPIGLGTIPNPSQATPVASRNRTENIIRTASGNEILLDDKIDEAQIYLTTPSANKILFDDKDDKIQISTTEKHVVTMDDKNQNMTVKTKDGHLLILDDKNTKITVQSKNGHRISINDSSGSENITLTDKDDKNKFVIDISNQKIVVLSEEGDIDIHAENGTISMKATELNIETSGDTNIKSDANIAVETGGDYDLAASGNITEEASGDLSQKGMNISSEASMEHKSKGTDTTVEAWAHTQIKGPLVTVEASGVNTIKGSFVKIN